MITISGWAFICIFAYGLVGGILLGKVYYGDICHRKHCTKRKCDHQ